MVQIRIDFKDTADDSDGILIELQGSFEIEGIDFISQQLRTNQSVREILIGYLQTKNDPITLRIGNHLLEGTKISLKKPLLLVKKTIPSEVPTSMKVDLSSDMPLESTDIPVPKYVIEKIYRTKYLFKTRPEYRPVQDTEMEE